MLRIIFFLLFISSAALAQTNYSSCESNTVLEEPLFSFRDYPVNTVFMGSVAMIDSNSHPWASQFRTALSNAVEQGANFAGYFSLAQWGCGSGCQAGAVVNLETGVVTPLPESTSVGAAYSLNSRLLILNPLENLQDAYPACKPEFLSSRYFILEERGFIELLPMASESMTTEPTRDEK